MAKKKAAKKVKAKKPKTAQQLLKTAAKLADQYDLNDDAKQAEALLTLRRLCDGLAGVTGLKKIIYTYSGEGDSGAMEDVTFDPPPSVEIPEALRDELENCAWQFVPSGFEINEGGSGIVIIDVPKGSVRLEHSERVVETIDTEEEFKF